MIQDIRRRPIAAVVCVLVAALIVPGCGAGAAFSPGQGNKYRYAFDLVAPAAGPDLLYRDADLMIQFRIDDAAVKFQLQNLSDSVMTIEWPKATVGVEGRFSPVRHAATLYTDSPDGAEQVLPSMGYIRDLVIPVENIRRLPDGWSETDLVPTTDGGDAARRQEILAAVGRQVSVILPLRFGDRQAVYEFAFQVRSVSEIAWRDVMPVERVPAPPIIKKKAGAVDQMTMAIIAVGVLGFVAYVLSLKKNPPSE